MKEKDNADRDERYAAWVGFDWGDQEHVWALQWSDTGERERGRLEQTPEALEVWLGQLMSRLNGRRIGVAIEQKHGAVVYTSTRIASEAEDSESLHDEPQGDAKPSSITVAFAPGAFYGCGQARFDRDCS
jgi:hypothetical protein